MINARELMIGNYLQENRPDSQKIIQVNSFSNFFINGLGVSAFEPIPLTEELLLRFGFTIRDKTYSLNYGGESMRYAFLEIGKNTFVLYFHGRHGFNTNEGRKNGEHCIFFVHQLQNLYFALTNKELVLQE